MGLAHIPTSNSCLLCHEKGGAADLKPDPGHRAPARGLDGLPDLPHGRDARAQGARVTRASPRASASTATRWPRTVPPITQAHAELQEPCLDCHGTVAHLPSSMVGRNQDECWLCHKPNPAPPPDKPHPDPAEPDLPVVPPVVAGGCAAHRPRPPRGEHLHPVPRHRGEAAGERRRHAVAVRPHRLPGARRRRGAVREPRRLTARRGARAPRDDAPRDRAPATTSAMMAPCRTC